MTAPLIPTTAPVADADIDTLAVAHAMGAESFTEHVNTLVAARTREAYAAGAQAALRQAAAQHIAELVCCDVYERLSPKAVEGTLSEVEKREMASHSICYWGAACAEGDLGLAGQYAAEAEDPKVPGVRTLAEYAESIEPTNDVVAAAKVLMATWGKVDPRSGVALHYASYVATFYDMALAMVNHFQSTPEPYATRVRTTTPAT